MFPGLVAALATFAGSGCDLPPDHTSGPAWLGTIPPLEESSDARSDTPILRLDESRAGTELLVRFSHPLQPASVGWHTVTVRSGEVAPRIRPYADPTLPGLRIVLRDRLIANVNYRLSVEGVRDLDGFVGEKVEFVVSARRTSSERAPLVRWSEVEPLFVTRCASCHDGHPLDLRDSDGLRDTAVEVRARGVDLPRPGPGVAPSGGGLVGMSIVEPLRPGRSYMIYKILGDPHIAGDPMPPAPGAALSADEMELLVQWIAAGAPLPE